jgi:glutathione S-transferase
VTTRVGRGWVGIAQARELPGLRLVLMRGLPSPWSLAARHVFEVKGIPFTPVERGADEADALLAWTDRASLPVAVHGRERPRSGWAEILHLAERLSPRPALIPVDPGERALMFGLGHELLGELGLAWCRRLLGLRAHFEARPDDPEVRAYRHRYGSGPRESETALPRARQVLALLAEQLERQRARGSEFLVGTALSAADLYWAASSHLIAPLADHLLPLPDALRAQLAAEAAPLRPALSPALLAHRDEIHRRFLRLPVEL